MSMDFIAGGLVELLGGLALGDRAVRLRLVGAARAGRRLAGDALAAARERRLARPQHRRGARGPARRRLRLPAGGRSAGGQGAAAVRARRLDDRPVRRPAQRAARAAVRGDPAARALAGLAACCSCWPPTRSCSGRSRRRRWTARSASAQLVVFAQAALGASAIAFGGLNWALDGAAAPVAAVLRLRAGDRPRAGALDGGDRPADAAAGRARSASATSTFAYPAATARRCCEGFDLTIPAGTSLAIVGQNGAGKTTLAKLLCRLYDPQSRRDRGRRRRPARARPRRLAEPGHRGVPGLHPVRVAAARQRRPARRARRRRSARRCAAAGAADLAEPRHGPGQGLRGRHRPVRRAVAAGRAGPGAVRGAAGRRRGAARRADRAARRARRGRDLRAHPRRDPATAPRS